MGFLKKLSYIVNPLGAIIDQFQHTNDNSHRTDTGKLVYNDGNTTSPGERFIDKIKGKVQKLWNDYTGQTQIDKEFENNKELAQYEADMNEAFYNKYSSPEAMMRQYEEAKLNPNLIYSGSGSGQGNVPSYSSPSAIRKMSPIQQLSGAMSLITGLMNIENLKYNLTANRELAEQSGLKTLSLFEDIIGKRNKNKLNSLITGISSKFNIDPFFKKSLFGRYTDDFHYKLEGTDYTRAQRSLLLNRAMSSYLNNLYEYGHGIEPVISEPIFDMPDYTSNAFWRNKVLQYDANQRKFNFEWDDDYKTVMKSAGFAAPIIQSLIRILGGK